jgi:hypothetical protein
MQFRFSYAERLLQGLNRIDWTGTLKESQKKLDWKIGWTMVLTTKKSALK